MKGTLASLTALLLTAAAACDWGEQGREARPAPLAPPASEQAKGAGDYARQRAEMVERQLLSRDIHDPSVLQAMGRVPRQLFVPEEYRQESYGDYPLPIGHRQTISQPYIVALMTQLAKPAKSDRALDIGTGSGYQAAVLAELVKNVVSIEILCPLANEARDRLKALGYRNVEVHCGDGFRGWAKGAPFDVIIVAAAASQIPRPLIEQLAPGGRLIMPVGGDEQELVVVEKAPDGSVTEKKVLPVRFVPMTGEAQGSKDEG